MSPTVNQFLMGNPRYRVIAAAVVAELIAGPPRYLSRGDLLPVETDPAQVEHLLGLGMIKQIGSI